MSTIEWRPIDSAPYDIIVLLTGNSGMLKPYDKYVTVGYRNKIYHNKHWNEINGDLITDQFYEPTHWADMINLPEEK